MLQVLKNNLPFSKSSHFKNHGSNGYPLAKTNPHMQKQYISKWYRENMKNKENKKNTKNEF